MSIPSDLTLCALYVLCVLCVEKCAVLCWIRFCASVAIFANQAFTAPLVKPLMNWRIATANTQSRGMDEIT